MLLLVAGFLPLRSGLIRKLVQVDSLVNEMWLEKASSEYFGFPCQFPFNKMLHFSPLLSGPGTMARLWSKYQGVGLFPMQA
jgi:hypothetical protein